ncbi:Hypothetical protein NTJ_09181 [Nesidiocoris tenuis]|uniref:Uncharacterized protein n=1 Tax=Nesidiocoris tenuis TaxID=355587 RepID=A0ABN7AW01_9HEMI|nr:Hypothetical protein NTJ_09181 [Nesidiocoris tenuis]
MFDRAGPDQQNLPQLSNIKPKNTNWFDNIRSLKLLEGLRSSPTTNPMRAVYFDMKPYKGNQHQPNVEDANNESHTEKMIAEGVIPLKTGSTLNLYISYVLNRTKEHKNIDNFSDSNPAKEARKTM